MKYLKLDQPQQFRSVYLKSRGMYQSQIKFKDSNL